MLIQFFVNVGIAVAEKYDHHYRVIDIVFVDDLSEIPRQMYRENGSPMFAGIYFGDQKHCRVYVLRPKGFDDYTRIETLGHEIYHCIVGPHDDEYLRKHGLLQVQR